MRAFAKNADAVTAFLVVHSALSACPVLPASPALPAYPASPAPPVPSVGLKCTFGENRQVWRGR